MESPISDADYAHAQREWMTFNMHTFGEHHDLYLLTDVLLLADVFKSFRYMAIRDYHLDPCHFFSLPGLSWNTMLKMTGIKITGHGGNFANFSNFVFGIIKFYSLSLIHI